MPDIGFPCYPAELTGELKLKFLYLAEQFLQLQHLWEVQLKDHRNYWNIRAAYDFWCENGTKTVHGRQFGWSERWLLDAMNEVREEVHRLEEVAERIKNAKAAKRARRLVNMRVGHGKGKLEGRKVVQRGGDSSDDTEVEPDSPTHKPPRRPPGLPNNKRLNIPGLGTRERPIMIVQESDEENNRGERPSQTGVTWKDNAHQENVRPPVGPTWNASVNKDGKASEHESPQHNRDEYVKEHAEVNPNPTTPVMCENASSRDSASTSPTKKRSRSRDAAPDGRPRKSPKHRPDSYAGSDSSGGEGGCSLSLINEEGSGKPLGSDNGQSFFSLYG